MLRILSKSICTETSLVIHCKSPSATRLTTLYHFQEQRAELSAAPACDKTVTFTLRLQCSHCFQFSSQAVMWTSKTLASSPPPPPPFSGSFFDLRMSDQILPHRAGKGRVVTAPSLAPMSAHNLAAGYTHPVLLLLNTYP